MIPAPPHSHARLWISRPARQVFCLNLLRACSVRYFISSPESPLGVSATPGSRFSQHPTQTFLAGSSCSRSDGCVAQRSDPLMKSRNFSSSFYSMTPAYLREIFLYEHKIRWNSFYFKDFCAFERGFPSATTLALQFHNSKTVN